MSTIELGTDHEIHLGSTVSFTDQVSDRKQTITIVAPHDAAAGEGKLSAESPIARALIGHRVGDQVDVHVPRGVRPLLIAAVS
jgi:transcription elongation factor GreA